MNLIAFLIGIVALLLTIPSAIPLLGWGNWMVLPIALVGVLFGAFARSSSGRNFCLIVFGIAALRLIVGGGLV